MPLYLWSAIGAGIFGLAWLLFHLIRRLLGISGLIAAAVLLAMLAFATVKLHALIIYLKRHPIHLGLKTQLPIAATSNNQFKSPFQTNPFHLSVHINSWALAIGVPLIAVVVIVTFMWKTASPETKGDMYRRWDSTRKKRKARGYTYTPIELAVNKETGKPITISGKDRFINTLVVGVTGTGKTSRILRKAILQDLRAIASGIPMDVMILEPEGEFARDVQKDAKKFGLHVDTIDIPNGESTLSFNPFAGGDIADIIDNVRDVLKEQMGKQESFFQNAQDNLVRTVIQVQVPLWPQTDFAQFAELVTDPLHFRAVCNMIYEYAMKPKHGSRKKEEKDEDEFPDQWLEERPYIESRYAELETHVQSMVLSAARSFLDDTRTAQRLERLETITKGLKIVVSEISTNPRLQKVLNTTHLPPMNFQTFLDAGMETQGRVITVVTGNSPAGKLFGKLWLVSFQMYMLRRSGTEDTRRPVYKYIDEFHKYATTSLGELFSQIRKYRGGLMLATQTRADLQIQSNRNFLRVVEANSRNKIYFPSPDPDDAKHLQEILGSVTKRQIVHPGNANGKASYREQQNPRFRVEDLMYGLRKEEAVFQMTVDNQAQIPAVGITTYGQAWADAQRSFYSVSTMSDPVNHDPPVDHTQQVEHQKEAVGGKTAPFSAESSFPNVTSNATIAIPRLVEHKTVDDTETTEDVESSHEETTSSTPTVHTEYENKPNTSTDDDDSRVQRVDLRRRQNKRCPDCGARLELSDDEKKWLCTSCEYSRKNRK